MYIIQISRSGWISSRALSFLKLADLKLYGYSARLVLYNILYGKSTVLLLMLVLFSKITFFHSFIVLSVYIFVHLDVFTRLRL